jgi:hypothetical protein
MNRKNETTNELVVALLLAAAKAPRVPARCWPLEIALERLAVEMPKDSALSHRLTRWTRTTSDAGRTFAGIDSLLRDLALRGTVRVEGAGWDAGYRLTERALAEARALIGALSSSERRALQRAAQRLVASLSIWSKNSLDERPTGSSTI